MRHLPRILLSLLAGGAIAVALALTAATLLATGGCGGETVEPTGDPEIAEAALALHRGDPEKLSGPHLETPCFARGDACLGDLLRAVPRDAVERELTPVGGMDDAFCEIEPGKCVADQ